MCYVGKASKIFILIVGVLVVTGVVLGLGFFKHGFSHQKGNGNGNNGGSGSGSTPVFSNPIPITTAGPPVSLPPPFVVSQGPTHS
ncbi:hypothetical protein AMTRI_Chr02g259000 [Amborella trichopoda]